MLLVTDFIKNLVLTTLNKTNLSINVQQEVYFVLEHDNCYNILLEDGSKLLTENDPFICTNLDRIVHYINLSLTHLHSKFLLLQKQCLIQLVVPHTEYILDYMYADSNVSSTVPHKYIKDSVNKPYYPYLIKILYCTDENGNNIRLNDGNDLNSVHLMNYNTIQVSYSGDTVSLSGNTKYINVIYQANHVPITLVDIKSQYINIAPFLEECLKNYVSYMYFSDELGQKNIQKSQEAYNNYIMKINEITTNNMIHDYGYTNLKLENKGFI